GFDPAGGEAIDADLRGEADGEAASESHDGAFDRGEHFAGIAAHAELRLVPAGGEDRERAGRGVGGDHTLADFSRKTHGAGDVDAPEELELGFPIEVAVRAGEDVGASVIHPDIDTAAPG